MSKRTGLNQWHFAENEMLSMNQQAGVRLENEKHFDCYCKFLNVYLVFMN